MPISVCGVFECDSCEHYALARCSGCREANKLLERQGLDACALYKCATEQGLGNCGECGRASCEYARNTDCICPLRGSFENRRWWAWRLAKRLGDRGGRTGAGYTDKISDRTIERVRWYLIALDSLATEGITSVSSWQLAQRVGVKAPLIRKDLSRFGEFGTPSFGYDVKYLRRKIMDILGLNESRSVVWLGARKLREQLPAISQIQQHRCRIAAVLDSDPEEIGKEICGVQVVQLNELASTLQKESADLAVVGLAAAEAQRAASVLVRGGITAILNLSPTLLIAPDHVTVRNVDVGGELLALSYYCGKRGRGTGGAGPASRKSGEKVGS